jgi:P-type Cu2+ transporter
MKSKTESAGLWQNPDLLQHVIRELPGGHSEVCVLVDDIRCNGCVLLIERTLTGIPGVTQAQVNALTRRARIVFDAHKVGLADLISALNDVGHQARPLDAAVLDDARRHEARSLLKQLAVAGFGSMQGMMFAFIIYFGPPEEIKDATLELFRWLGFLVASPVVLYSGQAFFKGAFRGLRAKQVNMDVPIAIAIGIIYIASLYQAIQGGGEVYFDSISMLIFFLLSGRFIEMKARHRSIDNTEALAQLMPNFVERRSDDGTFEKVSVNQLKTDNIIRIAEGGHIPADGILLSTHAQIDESLLSGEPKTQFKKTGDTLISGSLVLGSPIELRVTQCGENTFLATLSQLANRAQTQRPRLALVGQKAAARFVIWVLGLSALTSIVWMLVDPDNALQASLAVLVVACPCAFALAVPAAITRSLAVLARRGILVIDPDAIEKLASFDYAIFDKTGTLTSPIISVKQVDASLTEEQALQIAASLAQHSSHPLSKAILSTNKNSFLPATQVSVETGMGLKGYVNECLYHLGRADFASKTFSSHNLDKNMPDLVLSDGHKLLASFQIDEQLREDALASISALQKNNVPCEIISGDAESRVAGIALDLGIKRWQARCLPADKLTRIRNLQDQGYRVLVIGDGSNDAPILAGADVSVALASGTDLAQAQADIVLCSERLYSLVEARDTAKQTMQILLQNQRWALGYNLSAMPLAALGFVSPWLAAIGMSTSSLVVVLNALRIGKDAEKQNKKITQEKMPRAKIQPTDLHALRTAQRTSL